MLCNTYMLIYSAFSLCNIVAGKVVVKELIQRAVTPEAICTEMKRLLQETSYRENLCWELARIRETLEQGEGVGAAARAVYKYLTA